VELDYSGFVVSGQMSIDDITMTAAKPSTLNFFSFLAINSAKGESFGTFDADGVLGLSAHRDEKSIEDGFINSLFQAK